MKKNINNIEKKESIQLSKENMRLCLEIFIKCAKNWHEWMLQLSEWDMIKYILNTIKYLWSSLFIDGPTMFLNDLEYVLSKKFFNDKRYIVQEDVKDKVVILLQWVTSNIWAMPKLYNAILEEWMTPYPINKRVLFHNMEEVQKEIFKLTRRSVINMRKEGKEIVLFWYSYGWAIAEWLWQILKIPVVTYWAPLDSSSLPVTLWFQLCWQKIKPVPKQGEQSIAIVEEYSLENPLNWDRRVAKGVLGHFTMNRDLVVSMIMSAINESFEKHY